ncbi:TolC family outer membrane protein [Kushneria phosphatilytica]|uniref:TolC family outer membrane protein n=1 Tax=Kushneria phosphatilytica TaxID=657387 RepID=A0A1S1NYY7_9GAMM|nr:TolC family outer membrane protein [Kushneria phosphatilytica]OHV10605.1 type I secretion protein TolC [Kushneria phosphatilytica]QEL11814.1 TolC family outer membrane protein [Kushneria phosphatilytica]
MPKFRVLPLVIAVSVASQAQAADLMTVARDALINNADLAASRAGYSSTREGEAIARGDLLPQVTASGSMTRYNIDSQQSSSATSGLGNGGTGLGGNDNHYSSRSVQVEATQALFDATNWYQLEAAKRETAQEALSLAGDRQQLLYNVAEAYFNVLRAKEQLDTLRAEERAVASELRQARQQFDVGTVAATDVYEAQATYDQTRSERIAQESTLQVNFERLEQLTGQQYASIDGLADNLPIKNPEPASRDAWVDMASTQNLDLKAARAGIEVARSNLDTSRAGHLPTLSAFANYQWGDSTNDQLDNDDDRQTQVGIQASVPIYSGGSTSAQVRQSTYSLEQSQYQAESSLRSAVQNVRSYFASVVNDVLTVQARQRSIQSNRASLEATRSGYEVGTRNIVDVLDAQQNLYSAIYDYADARYNYITDLLSLRQSAGILDVGTIQTLNDWLRDDKAVRLDFLSQYQQEGEGDNTLEGAGNSQSLSDLPGVTQDNGDSNRASRVRQASLPGTSQTP